MVVCSTSVSPCEPGHLQQNRLNLPTLSTTARRTMEWSRTPYSCSRRGEESFVRARNPLINPGSDEAPPSSATTTSRSFAPFHRPSGGNGQGREVWLVLRWISRPTPGRRCTAGYHVLQTGAERTLQPRKRTLVIPVDYSITKVKRGS